MQTHQQPRRTVWYHPLLFAVFPALSLLAANIDQVPWTAGVRMVAASLVLGVLAYISARMVLKDWGRGALATSMILAFLLGYGRLYDGLKEVGLSGAAIVRHRYLLPMCAVLLVGGVVWCARRRGTTWLDLSLNVASLVVVLLPLARIGSHLAYERWGARAPETPCSLHPPAGRPLPDVYIIIMDSYQRDDVLRELYGFDNTAFLEALEDLGFYVARGSLSNYRHTTLSLSSMLNMEYVQSLPEMYGIPQEQEWPLIGLITKNRVRQELECLGYVTVSLSHLSWWTEWGDADYRIQVPGASGGVPGVSSPVGGLEILFLRTTAVRLLLDKAQGSPGVGILGDLDPGDERRMEILFSLDQLSLIPRLPTPKLVFIHVLAPHPPYVLGRHGEAVDVGRNQGSGGDRPGQAFDAYVDEVIYLNERLLTGITAIVGGSSHAPMIILMGDHGLEGRGAEDELSILNACLVPDTVKLYPTITPVNTFRAIFDGAFGGSYGRLSDVSYFSQSDDKFALRIVPSTWQAAPP